MSHARCLRLLPLVMLIAAIAAVEGTAQDFARYQNRDHRFAFEFPSRWVTESKKTGGAGSALIFSGPEGSDEYYTTINVQVVTRRPDESLGDQVAGLLKQFSTAPQYRLIEQEDGRLAGRPAARLLVRYQLRGSEELYMQEQFVASSGDSFYLVGFTAPENLFERYRRFMEHAVATFEFLPAGP